MDTIGILGSTLGLSFVAGIRLYATVLALGLAIRLNWLHLGANQEALRTLAHPAVLAAAAIAYLAEFFLDKTPWVDSVWDSFHTFIRPIGAAMLAAAALGPIDPALKLVLIILCGGVAFASHSSKAATRFVVNHSPEPFSNVAISLAEDALAPIGLWLSFAHPLLVLVLVVAFLAGFVWVTPKVFRAIRLPLTALWVWLKRGSGKKRGGTSPRPVPTLRPEASRALGVVAANACPIAGSCAQFAAECLGQQTPALGIRAAATKSIPGLRNSIGYLVIGRDDLAFVAQRWFRRRIHRIQFAELVDAGWKKGLLMNTLVLRTTAGDRAFYVFKDVDARAGSNANPASAVAQAYAGSGFRSS